MAEQGVSGERAAEAGGGRVAQGGLAGREGASLGELGSGRRVPGLRSPASHHP